MKLGGESMARLVDSNVRNSSANTYGRSLNANIIQERAATRVQVVKAYGTINSSGVCPDGSTCNTTDTPTEVEFTLNIYKRGNEYAGEVYIVNYDTRKKVNSNQLIYYQDHDGVYVLCIFYVCADSGNCTYELIVNLTPTGCGTTGSLYAYVMPIFNTGLNIGGTLTAGEIILGDTCQKGNNVGPICNPLPYTDQGSIADDMDSCPCSY